MASAVEKVILAVKGTPAEVQKIFEFIRDGAYYHDVNMVGNLRQTRMSVTPKPHMMSSDWCDLVVDVNRFAAKL